MECVFALGPEFSAYGTALHEKNMIDSTFLTNLTEREIEILFAFIPQAHQVRLESLLPQNAHHPSQDVPVEKTASQYVPVEKPLPTLAYNSGDYDDDTLPVEKLRGSVTSWQQLQL